jgi:hypothetical protein
VIPLHDVRNRIASMDKNKPMEGSQSYLGMNSMLKMLMAWLKNINDVLTEDHFLWIKTFDLISYGILSLSSPWLNLLQQELTHHS